MNPNDRRVAIFRVLKIATAIWSRRGVTAPLLARELETSERTIMRDIDFLRDSLKHRIEWDSELNQYFYTKRPLSLTDPNNRNLL
jgi:predicted DNA-binding transcriptional regulator YafY